MISERRGLVPITTFLAVVAVLWKFDPRLASLVAVAVALIFWPAAALALSWAGLFLAAPFLPGRIGLALSLAVALLAALSSVVRPTERASHAPADRLMLGWTVWGVLAACVMYLRPPNILASDRPLQFVVGFVLIVLTPFVLRTRHHVVVYLIVLAAMGTVVSIAEQLRLAAGGVIHAETVSFGLNPIYAGRFCALGAMSALMLWRLLPPRPINAALMLGAAAIGAVGTVATGSRGPFAGLALAALIMLAGRGASQAKYTRVRVALAVAVVAIPVSNLLSKASRAVDFSSSGDASISTRLAAWQDAVTTMFDHPVLGAGVGNFTASGAHSALGFPHNLVLEVGADLGLALAAAFVVLLVSSLMLASTEGRALIAGVLVDVLFSGNLGTAQILWAACGLSIALMRVQAVAPKPARARQHLVDQPRAAQQLVVGRLQ